MRTAANIDKGWMGTDAVKLFEKATGRSVAVVNDADAAGIAEVRFGAGAGRKGMIIVVTLGTGIGSGLFMDGVLVPNTELGHLHLHHGDAEEWASDAARDRDDLSWEEYAKRLEHYLELLQSLFWPNLIIIGGGISKKADKYLPHIKIDTEVVPATLQNEAGIAGAAMFAPPDPRQSRSRAGWPQDPPVRSTCMRMSFPSEMITCARSAGSGASSAPPVVSKSDIGVRGERAVGHNRS